MDITGQADCSIFSGQPEDETEVNITARKNSLWNVAEIGDVFSEVGPRRLTVGFVRN